jgi:hypothetical protein
VRSVWVIAATQHWYWWWKVVAMRACRAHPRSVRQSRYCRGLSGSRQLAGSVATWCGSRVPRRVIFTCRRQVAAFGASSGRIQRSALPLAGTSAGWVFGVRLDAASASPH